MTEASEREEKRREYGHGHMDIDIRHKTKVRRFYVNQHFEQTFEQLQKILRREGRSLSEWVRSQAEPYVHLHEPGNPQQQLDVILELGKAYNANGCFECGKKPFVMAWRGKRQILLCQIHLEKLKKKLSGWKEI